MYSLKAPRAQLECVGGSERCQLNKRNNFLTIEAVAQRMNKRLGRLCLLSTQVFRCHKEEGVSLLDGLLPTTLNNLLSIKTLYFRDVMTLL